MNEDNIKKNHINVVINIVLGTYRAIRAKFHRPMAKVGKCPMAETECAEKIPKER
jgi:hypothetical protein